MSIHQYRMPPTNNSAIISNSFGLMLKTLVLTIAFVFPVAKANAYTMPIGIPPLSGWGAINPLEDADPDSATVCPNWPTAASTNCYYIDNTSPNATDSSNTHGYPNKPRLSFPGFQILPAGTYVKIAGGPYTSNYTKMIFHGTTNSPAWIVGDSVHPPIITGQLHIGDDTTFLIMDNLDFNGGSVAGLAVMGSAINHVCIRNSKFRNKTYTGNTSAVALYPAVAGVESDIVVYNSEFYSLGDWLAAVDQDFHGVGISGNDSGGTISKVWVLNNLFYYISGDAVQVISTEGGDVRGQQHHIYMGKNIAHDNRQAAFWSKQSRDVIISQNTAYNNRAHGPQIGTGIGCQYGPDNLWIIFNDIYASDNGIRQSSTLPGNEAYKVYIVGNKIHNIHPVGGDTYSPTEIFKDGQAIALHHGIEQRWIVDNTIYDASGGIDLGYAGPVTLSGNIISNITNPNDFSISNFNATAVTDLDHNLFYNSVGSPRFYWGGSTYTSLTDFKSGSGKCPNCLTKDPLFINPASDKFAPKFGTPLREKSSRNAVYDVFEARYGLSIAYDFNGYPRPATGAWTIGAFEVPALINDKGNLK